MKQPSAAFPLEKILVFQRVICILLIALMLLSCRGGFFVVPFDDDFSDMYTELDSEDKEEFKDSVFVKFDFFGSSLAIFKLIYFANANGPELDNAYQEVMSISSGHSLAIRSNAIAFLIIEGFDSELFAGIYFSLLALTSITLPLHFLADSRAIDISRNSEHIPTCSLSDPASVFTYYHIPEGSSWVLFCFLYCTGMCGNYRKYSCSDLQGLHKSAKKIRYHIAGGIPAGNHKFCRVLRVAYKITLSKQSGLPA